jgi:nucleoside-diphosphate-sugar epimerase
MTLSAIALRCPSLQDVDAAVAGVDVVVHVATATPTSENALNKQLMDDVNVKGTQHVISACKKHGVRNMVYTSSASGGGLAPLQGGGEGVGVCGCVSGARGGVFFLGGGAKVE